MRRITGSAQHYAWGDREAIPTILGQAADGQPWAEWWLGTHSTAPATIIGDGLLADVAGALPYLLKLLAAAAPLSLQTHPSESQAAAGFEREEAAGLPLGAPARVYRDCFAKPELLCALTSFDMLCGFRPVGDTEALLHSIGATDLAAELRQSGLAGLVDGLYRGRLDPAATVASCTQRTDAEATLVADLWQQYPGDPAVVVTLLLNRITLQPGEATFLHPGNLHAYLRGVGVEVMGNSDNVIRGGLTSKHIDVDELLRVVDFSPLRDPRVHPREVEPGRWCYDTPVAPFGLWRFEVSSSMPHTASGREILVCTRGDVGALHHGEAAYLAPGESIVLSGPSTVFRVEERP